jgi:predicted O-methyltransferase YrrM
MKWSIFTEPVELYLARTAVGGDPLHPVFEELQREANERTFPIVGPEVGRFFLQLAMLHRPRRILELGSGFGYSAVWWALGAPEAEIHLTDFREKNLRQAADYLARVGATDRIHLHPGDALEVAGRLEGPWDLIFCDIDKEEYPAAADFAATALRPGGVLLFDNILNHGYVAAPEEERGPAAEAIIETTRRLYNDPRWRCSILPIRDGILLALKVADS